MNNSGNNTQITINITHKAPNSSRINISTNNGSIVTKKVCGPLKRK
jgi:hypothetical protein